MIRPYNGNYFDVRYKYSEVFYEDELQQLGTQRHNDYLEQQGPSKKNKKLAKIQYQINTLLQTEMFIDEFGQQVNEGISLIEMCHLSNEVSLLLTPGLQSLIQYKWDTFGRHHHLLGMGAHLMNTVIIVIYITQSYLREAEN
jgi:hypothetical protein